MNKLKYCLEISVSIFLDMLGFLFYLLKIFIKSPMRIKCAIKGHDLRHDNGFFGMFAPNHPFYCLRCGKRSKGDFDSLRKNFPKEFKKKGE